MNEITKNLFSYIVYVGPTGIPPPRDLDKIKSFIEKGAELDKVHAVFKRDLLTSVILNTKSKRERLAIVKLLVESGAKVNFKTKFGPSPISSAIDCLDYKVTKYLLENGVFIKTERDLHGSKMIEKDRIEFLDLLLDHGLDVNSKTTSPGMVGANDDIYSPGNSLLIDAVYMNAIKLIERLLENDVDINYAQPFTGSALARAVHNNRVEALSLLLKAGGNPNEIISPGKGPSILRKAIQRGHLECIQLLLKHGAIINGSFFPEDLENKNVPSKVKKQISTLLNR